MLTWEEVAVVVEEVDVLVVETIMIVLEVVVYLWGMLSFTSYKKGNSHHYRG